MTERHEKRVQVEMAIEHDTAQPVRLVMRPYFSAYLLWTAQHQAALADEIESSHRGRSRFSIEHRAYVLSSLIASAGFLETMVNELYQDAADGHASYVGPLSAGCRSQMVELWHSTNAGRGLDPLAKYEKLLDFAQARPLDRGARPYQDAYLVTRVRNAILHYHSENISADDEAHAMEKSLRGKFDDTALMAGSGNPWWPDHALGHGCALWAHRSVKALADHVVDALGIEPNYRRLEASGWFGHVPGNRERSGAVPGGVGSPWPVSAGLRARTAAAGWPPGPAPRSARAATTRAMVRVSRRITVSASRPRTARQARLRKLRRHDGSPPLTLSSSSPSAP